MNKLFIIFVALVEANNLQQILHSYYLGNEELMVPSIADKYFEQCCAEKIVDTDCTKKLCSISGISSMTAAQFVSYGEKCRKNIRQIWGCAHHMSSQSDCCVKW
ncbi:hypothetical protein DINM_004723 [Dirofilaria immitis]|nr:hypothetical protein [Dirofilaria immitis]